jgi:hypothetical protein
MAHVMRDECETAPNVVLARVNADSYRCVPTLSEVRQRVVSIQIVQRQSGKIQTGRIPPSVETPIVSPWQVDRSRACVRLGSLSGSQGVGTVLIARSKNCNSKPVFIENGRGM